VHPWFHGDSLTRAFVTGMPDLLAQAKIWIHGHHHDSSGYVERGCRVVCGPCGDPKGLNTIRIAEAMHLESTEFHDALIIQLPVHRAGSAPA